MAKRKMNDSSRKRIKGPRINSQITEDMIRVVSDGKGAELMPREQALTLAREMGMDLVEVSSGQQPPVCKIINFGKWKYEQQKRKKEQTKHQHVIQIKEIKIRPKIGDHDYEIKRARAETFLDKGDKVKISLRFRGREMAHPELGMNIMRKMIKDLEECGTVEAPPKSEGRQIVMVLTPKGNKKKKPEGEIEQKELDVNESTEDKAKV